MNFTVELWATSKGPEYPGDKNFWRPQTVIYSFRAASEKEAAEKALAWERAFTHRDAVELARVLQ